MKVNRYDLIVSSNDYEVITYFVSIVSKFLAKLSSEMYYFIANEEENEQLRHELQWMDFLRSAC